MNNKKQGRRSWGKIVRQRSGRYQASYLGPDGQRYTAPHTFTAKTDADAWLNRTRTDIERDVWKSPAQIEDEKAQATKRAEAERFATYAQTWIAERVSSKGAALRPKTRTEYERQVRVGLAMFADDPLTAITPARVRAWHAERMKAGATAAGAEARLLRAVLNTAVVDGIVDANPVAASLTRTSTGRKHRPPTLDELSVILKTIDPRFRLAVLLAAYGNVRLSEWRALRRRDVMITDGRALVNVERQALYIAKTGWVVGEPKSADGVRVVPLPKALTADVRTHLVKYVRDDADALLFAPVGRSAFLHDAQFNDAWNPARDAAGVRGIVREHDLRAFALTSFAQAGGTLRETQAFGGHATVDAALRYQYAAQDRVRELVDRMPLPKR